MYTTISLTEERLLARIKIALDLSHSHSFDFVAAFLLEHGSAIDHACEVLRLIDVTPLPLRGMVSDGNVDGG